MRFFRRDAFWVLWKKSATVYSVAICMALLGSTACEEVVEPSLISADPVLVIEANVSNIIRATRVKLTTTTAFNNPNPNPKVSEAEVLVRQSTNGQTFRFEEVSPGEYLPLSREFKGSPGVLYTLEVITGQGGDEETYTSISRMPFPIPVDSITYQYEEERADREAGYYLFYHYQDPLGRNYHLVEVWRNNQKLSNDRIEIRNDENVRDKYLKLEIPYTFSPSDTVRIKITSLPEDVFTYYEGINSLTELGSPSEAVPENPNNNIVSDAFALGYFSASSSEEYTVILPEE